MNNEPVAWYNADDSSLSFKNHGGGWQPLYTHPVKELHLSFQKSKETGELLAVTYTDDEHRIVEVLWKRPPVKELTDEEILEIWKEFDNKDADDWFIAIARAILRKAKRNDYQSNHIWYFK